MTPSKHCTVPSSGITSQAALYLIGNVLNRAVGFLLMPMYTWRIPASDYGLAEILELLIQLMAMSVGLGIFGTAVMRSYHGGRCEARKRAVISTAFQSALLFNGALATVGIFASPWIMANWLHTPKFTRLLEMSFLSMAFSNCIEIGLSYLRLKQRACWYLLYSLGALTLTSGLNIWTIAYLNWGIWGITISKLVTTLIGVVLCGFLITKECGLQWRRDLVVEMSRFGAPLIFVNLAFFVIHFGDRFFLKHFASLEQIGVYSIAYRFGFLVTFLVGEPFYRVWNATVYEYVLQSSYKERIRLVWLCLFAALLCVALALSLFSRDLIGLMAGPAYRAAGSVIPIVVLAYVFRESGDFFRYLLFTNSRTTHVAIVSSVCALVNCVGNYFLIRSLGMFGAAWSTLITMVVYLALLLAASERERSIGFPVLRPMLLTGAALAVFAISFWVRHGSVGAGNWLLGALWILVFLVGSWQFGYLSREQQLALAEEARATRGRVRMALARIRLCRSSS